MPKGMKGFQKGHAQFYGLPKAEPAYCKNCGNQLAKWPSKRGHTGLCRKCSVAKPMDAEHKLKIKLALIGKFSYPSSDSHPRWTGGCRRFFANQARKILGVTDPNVHVHHKDGNWRNNDPSNLIAITKSRHMDIHRKDKSHAIKRTWETIKIRKAMKMFE